MASGGNHVCFFWHDAFLFDAIFQEMMFLLCQISISFFSRACCCAKMMREVVLFKPKRCGFCCVFSCGLC
jgi:hypothetical protein